jgi:hypothetical protein
MSADTWDRVVGAVCVAVWGYVFYLLTTGGV